MLPWQSSWARKLAGLLLWIFIPPLAFPLPFAQPWISLLLPKEDGRKAPSRLTCHPRLMVLRARTVWCPSTTAHLPTGFCPHITGTQHSVLDTLMGEQINSWKEPSEQLNLLSERCSLCKEVPIYEMDLFQVHQDYVPKRKATCKICLCNEMNELGVNYVETNL